MNAVYTVPLGCTLVCAALLFWCIRREKRARTKQALKYVLAAVSAQCVVSAANIAQAQDGAQNEQSKHDVFKEHLQVMALGLLAVALFMILADDGRPAP